MRALPSEVAVVGAGTMGAGIAAIFASGGSSVRLAARRQSSLDAARDRIPAIADDALPRITTTTDVGEALAGAELVVETIVEEAEPKRELLALAERLGASDAILTSNTSSLPLGLLAEPLLRQERFAGLHFINPPELVEVVEVIGAEATSPAVVETLVEWMEQLGKAPVVASRDTPGFILNRLQYAILREAYSLVETGVCSYADVDRVLTRGLGARWAAVGPFETVDLAGLDVHLAVARNLFPELSNQTTAPAALVERVEAGALGCKNGTGLRGVYTPEAVEALQSLRTRVLRGLPLLRDGKGNP
jgi:3-hydroxybutyryl-CoA dehydrogenase